MSKKDKSADGEAKPKKGGFFGIIIGLALASAFMLPTEIVLLIGMIPTIVMAFADTSSDHRGAIAIGTPNLAGVIPFLIELWQHGGGLGHDFAPAMKILADPMTYLVMYGAAFIGKAIYTYVPRAFSTFTALRAQSEINARRALQKKLEAQWGSDIAKKGKKS